MSKKFSKEFIREIVRQELTNVLKEQGMSPRQAILSTALPRAQVAAAKKTAVKKATEAVGKTGLKRIGAAIATRAGAAAAGIAATGPLAPIAGAIGTAYMAWDIGSMVYNLFTDDDSKEERADKVIQHIVQIPPEQAQHAAIRAQRFAPGPCKKDKQLGKKLKKAMTDAAKEAGTRSWRGLPYTHPARVDFRAWYKCRPIPSLQNTEQEKEIAMQELVDDPSLV